MTRRGTKLNAQVQLMNLQTMYERGTATSDQRRQLDLEYQDWARLQGRGPHTAGGHPWAKPPRGLVCTLARAVGD